MERYIVVAGCVITDIGGRSFRELNQKDSNPGKIRVSCGGVGKNIAHNLSLLGEKVYMLTALGGDLYTAAIREELEKAGIDTRYALECKEESNAVYLYILGPDGDMQLALCDAAIAERVDVSYIKEHMDLLNGAAAVVTDCNLPEKTIAYLADHCIAPLFADTVSVTKAAKLKNHIGKFAGIKPNVLESEVLLDRKIQSEDELLKAAESFIAAGTGSVFISRGAEGLCYASKDRSPALIPAVKTEAVNATGAGDAAMAAIVKAYAEGLDTAAAAEYAVRAGAAAVKSAFAVNPDMSRLK